MFGKGYQYETYLFSDPAQRDFYERYMTGEPVSAGWVNPSDFAVQPSDLIERK